MLKIKIGNIVDARSDAILFSTNEVLMLNGGAGKSLFEKYGDEFQDHLERCLGERSQAHPGEAFRFRYRKTQWRLIFAAVVVDADYHTEPNCVRNVLSHVFETCSRSHEIRSLTTTALGTGYGDLCPGEFAEILLAAISANDPFSVTLVLNTQQDFDRCLKHLSVIAPGAFSVHKAT